MAPEVCPNCGETVAAGRFCADCGARLAADRADGPLRRSAYAAAPRERLLRPWVTSSLFPQLPRRSRGQFRAGLIIVAAAAVGFALLRWPVPLIAVCVVGLPLLFAVYLRDIGALRGTRRRLFLLAMVFALGLGVAWALIAGPIVAEAYKAALGGQIDAAQVLLCGVAIPATFGLAMIAPAALVRAVDRSRGEALDGFTIGAVGATVVNASATATLLVPQLTMGLTADSQSVGGLLAKALIEGVAWPLGAVAVGGVFGIALWFAPRAGAPRRYRKSAVITAALLGAVAFTVAMGLVDVAPLPLDPYIMLQMLIAVSAMLAARIVIADALLHEWTDDTGDQRLRCAECDHVVARTPFCSDCGVAIRATSRTARAARAVGPASSDDPTAAVMPQPRAARLGVLGPVVAGLGASVALAVGAAVLSKPAPPAYACPPNCGGPSTGKPVDANPRFSGDNGAFSVAYPGDNPAYEVTFDPPGIDGVQLKYVAGDTGMLTLFGEQAGKRTPEQIVQQILTTRYPGANVAYVIPNASVGYQLGYGVVADVYPRDSASTYSRTRVIVMAAIRHGYALIATAAGPYHEFTPDYGSSHPSGANLELAMDMGKYVNSFRWYGDRYRRPS